MPVYDRPPPLSGADSAGVDSPDGSTDGDRAIRPRLYVEDCAGFAEALADEGDCDRARTEYLRVVFLGRTPELRFWAHMRIASCFYRNQAWEAGMQEFRQAAAHGAAPADRNLARFMAAGSAFNVRDYELCRDLLERISLTGTDAATACIEVDEEPAAVTREHQLFLEGLCLMGLADWDRAAGCFDDAANLCPQSASRERARFLADQSQRGRGLPGRSPAIAAIMSTLLPGSGQMYSGRFQDGLRHLIFDGLLIYSVYWLAEEDNYAGTYLAAGITLPFYVGNVVGAKRSAEWFNSAARADFIGDSINATR